MVCSRSIALLRCTVRLLTTFLTTIHSCYFFSSCCDHRDLHSFPTRRSSDRTAVARATARHPGAGRGRRRLPHRPRSEEHTSELQSLRHLVCRLLLEKKK